MSANSPTSTPIHAHFATGTTSTSCPRLPAPPTVARASVRPIDPKSPQSGPSERPFEPLGPPLPLSAPPGPAPARPTMSLEVPPTTGAGVGAGGTGGTGPACASEAVEPAIEDGPVFRAHVAVLEKRARSLRHSIKKLTKALEASLGTLREALAADALVDDSLDDIASFATTSSATRHGSLGDVYARETRPARAQRRTRGEIEIERGRELGERLKSSVDRLKLVDERKKEFDADSKRFYDDLAKYLAKPEPDEHKVALSDERQRERTESFRQNRIEYFSFVEGIVASEEHALAAWLVAWQDTPATANLDGARTTAEHSLTAVDTSREEWIHLDDSRTEDTSAGHAQGLLDALHLDSELRTSPSLSASPRSGERPTPSRSSTLDLAPPVSPGGLALSSSSNDLNRDARRRRRTSLPHWGLPSPSSTSFGGGNEKEGRRDRLKGFIAKSLTTAHNSIQSALPSSSTHSTSHHVLLSPTSDSFSPQPQPQPQPQPPHPLPLPRMSSPTGATTAPRTPPMSSRESHLKPPPSTTTTTTTAQAHARKKEGFLYATDAGQKHSTAGDGGARYSRFWVVLSEGQLIEYDRWSDALSVHGSPINLRYATARTSRHGGERRFCFEVLTPQLRRVYQATSEQDCSDWVATISKSVESLLNGTSSVRHFDRSRMGGPGSFSSEYASSLESATPSHESTPSAFPTSPSRGRFAPFLSRHASLGHARKASNGAGVKKDKRRSVQQSVPSFRFGGGGEEYDTATAFGGLLASRTVVGGDGRATAAVADHGGSSRTAFLDGLGIPFPLGHARDDPLAQRVAGASRSSPNLVVPRSRATTASPSEGFSTGEDGEDDHDDDDDGAASVVSEQDVAISDAVKRWAANEASGAGGGRGELARRLSGRPSDGSTKYRNAVEIVEIATDARLGNGTCADCRAAEPKWASWSLGIVLCIRCSGLHRGLGSHISKVRSIELDDWSDEQVAAMRSVGNARSNAFFESEMDPALPSTLTDSTMAQFVKQKYVEKKWVALVAATPPVTTTSFSPST